jgi:DNA-binding transcriptional LysR family regulator
MNDPLLAHRLFVRVARTGNFSRAGRELGLSQPSASRIIAKLETELGAALFYRSTRAIRLTDVGAAYLSRIEGVLDALDEANRVVRGSGELRGLLRVAMSSSFGSREIVPRLPDFLTAHPALRIDLIVSDERQNLVSDGVDVALRLGELGDSSHLVRKLARAPRMIVAAPNYIDAAGPVNHPSDLAARCLIAGPSVAPHTLEFTRDGQTLSILVQGNVSCSNNEGRTALVCAGLGISVVSLWGVRRELDQGVLVRILADWKLPSIDLHAVYAPGRGISPAARTFVDYLAASFKVEDGGIAAR